jgi:hypothetical protein
MKALLIIACLLTTGVAAHAADQVIRHRGVRSMVPAEWLAESTVSPSTRVWRSPEVVADPGPTADVLAKEAWLIAAAARAAVSISQQEVPKGQSLNDHAAATIATFMDLGTKVTVHGEGPVTIDGREWWQAELRFDLGTQPWRQRLVVTTASAGNHADYVFAVACSTGEGHWEQWLPVFERATKALALSP